MGLRDLLLLMSDADEKFPEDKVDTVDDRKNEDTYIIDAPAGKYPNINNVVIANLRLMSTVGEGTMPDLIATESMGGNAGSWNGYTCMGTSFCYDQNGRIRYFDNVQGIPDKFKHLPMGIFRVAITKLGELIVGVQYGIDNMSGRPSFSTSREAIRNLETTIKLYNAPKLDISLP